MGHADVQTTMRYLHFVPRAEDARLIAEAFRVEGAGVAPPMRSRVAEEVPRRP
jgi:hypothetical protein